MISLSLEPTKGNRSQMMRLRVRAATTGIMTLWAVKGLGIT
jgi:hypothetical protein